jgi:hypothetical protein
MEEEVKVQESTGMVINESVKADLLCSAKWAKFLSIVGCVSVVLLIIFGICTIAFMSAMTGSNVFPAMPGMGGIQAVMGVYYIILAALMIYPIIKGFQFANGVKKACLTGNEAELARGISGLKSILQFWGVLTIIALVIYGLFIVGGAVVAAIFVSKM